MDEIEKELFMAGVNKIVNYLDCSGEEMNAVLENNKILRYLFGLYTVKINFGERYTSNCKWSVYYPFLATDSWSCVRNNNDTMEGRCVYVTDELKGQRK